MADTAFQTQFRQETIATFEARQSLFRQSVTTEAVIKGNTATFLVAGSGGAEAVTRGVNGMIPSRGNDLTQVSATLREWHDKPRVTGFNIFASQGDQRSIMQREAVGVINRKIDSEIITELNTGTQDTGTTQTMTVALALRGISILGYNEVPFDGNVWGALTPAALAYLMQTTQFASADYVTMKPLDGDGPQWKDTAGFYRWLNVNWFVHPNLPGANTSAEKCFLYHRDAIGHAFNTEGMQTFAGYDEEDDYSYCRATVYMGSKLLQNSGVVVINHDATGFAAE